MMIPFFALNSVPGWILAGLLSVGLWLALGDALGSALGPRESPSRASEKRRILISAAALLVFGVCAFSAFDPLGRLAGFLVRHRDEALVASYLLLPPLTAVGYFLGRRSHRKRWFDVERRFVAGGS